MTRSGLAVAALGWGLLAGCGMVDHENGSGAGGRTRVDGDTNPSPVAVKPVTTQPTAGGEFDGCPIAEPLLDRAHWEQAKAATFRAKQVGGTVIVFADGEHPRGGYETKLAMNPTRIYPPQFTLYAKPPAGPSTTAMTPFSVCVRFGADAPVKTVTVFDATGRHDVPVEQAKE